MERREYFRPAADALAASLHLKPVVEIITSLNFSYAKKERRAGPIKNSSFLGDAALVNLPF
jgi:hypothetical protein